MNILILTRELQHIIQIKVPHDHTAFFPSHCKQAYKQVGTVFLVLL